MELPEDTISVEQGRNKPRNAHLPQPVIEVCEAALRIDDPVRWTDFAAGFGN